MLLNTVDSWVDIIKGWKVKIHEKVRNNYSKSCHDTANIFPPFIPCKFILHDRNCRTLFFNGFYYHFSWKLLFFSHAKNSLKYRQIIINLRPEKDCVEDKWRVDLHFEFQFLTLYSLSNGPLGEFREERCF